MTTSLTRNEQILLAHQRRFATKEYDPNKKINEQDFLTILEAGRLSPSSYGIEPWKFIVVSDPYFREQLMPIATGAARQLKGASHFVILLARIDVAANSDYVREQFIQVHGVTSEIADMMIQSLTGFQTRWGIDLNERTMREWAGKQTYIALANMLTTASYLGIDSTPIEGFDYEAVHKLLEHKGLLEDGKYVPSVMAAFGYHNHDVVKDRSRRSLEDVVQWV